jgi:hypothetical protein
MHGEGGKKRKRTRKGKEHGGEESGKRLGSARRADVEETQIWR